MTYSDFPLGAPLDKEGVSIYCVFVSWPIYVLYSWPMYELKEYVKFS